jgi:hypothetical protein
MSKPCSSPCWNEGQSSAAGEGGMEPDHAGGMNIGSGVNKLVIVTASSLRAGLPSFWSSRSWGFSL